MRTSISEISAGRLAARYEPAGERRSAGFTLMEILVVVLIVAITASIAVVNLSRSDLDTLRDEAVRLAASYRHAQDEAVMTGAALGWRGDADGYAYFRRTADGEWQLLDREGGIAGRRLEVPVRLVDVDVGGVKVAPGSVVVLSPSSMALPMRISMEANADRATVEIGARTRVLFAHGS